MNSEKKDVESEKCVAQDHNEESVEDPADVRAFRKEILEIIRFIESVLKGRVSSD